MKKLLLILLCLPMIGFGQQTYVPDSIFENILETTDANGYTNTSSFFNPNTVMGNGIPNDNYVTTANINAIAWLDLGGYSITDMTGIEGFTALEYLDCWGNQFTNLDLSQNFNMIGLECYWGKISDLNVNGLTNLVYLWCEDNQIDSLDVSSNINLSSLMCFNNNLSFLNTNGADSLSSLFCENNNLTSLDLSSNNNLTYVGCYANQLINLNTNNASKLVQLYCQYNEIISLDISTNSSLKDLECFENELTNINTNGADSLIYLSCWSNNLTSLDVSSNTVLTELYCHYNQLVSLNVKNDNNANWLKDLCFNYYFFVCNNNPSLTCITVDDANWSTTNLTVANGNIDSQHYFSTNCSSPSAIEEHTTNKELLKITDLLGRETKQTNQPLFYIYDDGTVEKRIVIE